MKKLITALHCWFKQLFWRTTVQKMFVSILSVGLAIMAVWFIQFGWKNVKIARSYTTKVVTEEVVSHGTFTTDKNIFLRDCEEYSYIHRYLRTKSGLCVYGEKSVLEEMTKQGRITYFAYIAKDDTITFGCVREYTLKDGVRSFFISFLIMFFILCIELGIGAKDDLVLMRISLITKPPKDDQKEEN